MGFFLNVNGRNVHLLNRQGLGPNGMAVMEADLETLGAYVSRSVWLLENCLGGYTYETFENIAGKPESRTIVYTLHDEREAKAFVDAFHHGPNKPEYIAAALAQAKG